METVRTYGGWQEAKSPFLLGLSTLQTMALAVAAVMLMAALTSQSLPLGIVLVMIASGLALAALLRWNGRPPIEWSGLAVRLAIVSLVGARRFIAEPITMTLTDTGGLTTERDQARLWELPGILHPLRHLAAKDPRTGRAVGVVHNPNQNSYTAVAEVSHGGLNLLDTSSQDARIAAWANVLARQCLDESGVSRISVYHIAEPGESNELLAWFDTHARQSASPKALELTRDVIATSTATTIRHATYIAVTISAHRAKREIKAGGGDDEAAGLLLLRRCAAIGTALQSAGVRVEEWLSPKSLAALIRESFAPGARHEHELTLDAQDDEQVLETAGPSASLAKWGVYEHDGYSSSVFEIAWPRTRRDAGILASLVSASPGVRRCVALHFEPLATREAERVVSTERTKRASALALRQKAKQMPSASERKALSATDAQDDELASGAGLVRFCGYVGVTAASFDQLELGSDQLQTDAGLAGLGLRRCAGWLDAAFVAAAVPVGMGLPGKGHRAG